MTLDRLQAHYGFTRMPFGRALAPGMLHRHTAHAEAVARISWCITERALGVVTGEVGAGKTVAVRAAIAALDTSRHTTIYLGNPAVGGRGLYGGIVTALGGEPRFHKAALIPQTADLLAAEEHERGRTVVLILDEAHLLTGDQLEELRLLTNADMDSHSPFACLLIGQPTLRRRIKLGTFAALDQRIALRYTLTAMSDTETASYLAHHLALAGRSDPLFAPREPAEKRPWPHWLEWKPLRIWAYDFTHFTRAKRCAVAVLDMVSRKWVATLVSAEETSTQVEVCFLAALEAEGLLEVIDQRDTERLRRALLSGHPEQIEAAVDGGQVPLLLAVSDNGPQMRSHSTREFLAGVHIAQHFGRPHTPTDQAWIETLFGHVKGEWPHLENSDDATALIHQVGRGTPRAVNNLAVQALVAAYAAGKAIVDESSARAAVTEVTTE
jgi:type II secretory pathway predicted ATPase ExeA